MLAVGSRYEVVGDIGEGGMGAVYRAVDRLTGQLVALKQLTRSPDEPDLNQDTITTQNLALAREFQILAALRHPHIVSVLDYGFTTDEARLPFFTMELLRRPATLVNYGRDRTVDERIDLIAQTLLALMYLHRHSIVHHDLKPGNVLVDQTGTVKLLDFGLSKPVGGQTSAGTLAYMAPELLMGGRSTEASDLYAIGVMAYELFAGERPIIADTVEELIRRVITKMPDYDLLAVTVGHGVAGVIERLLSKDHAGRFQNPEEVIEALR
ncbi:MAG: serine/threonine-protein kinase, partial [Anaerolineae bacterium]